MVEHRHILTLSCDGKSGIVAAVTAELAGRAANLGETAQFWDCQSNRFFLRIAFFAPDGFSPRAFEDALAPAKARFAMETNLADASRRPRIIILVSRFDHALPHLLYQIWVGWLDAEIAAIVSKHYDARRVAEHEGIPFHHWPVTRETKAAGEERLIALVEETGAEPVVPALHAGLVGHAVSQAIGPRDKHRPMLSHGVV